MGMNVGSNNDDDVMLEVNMTPLIDVMLVLIIMFIITIPAPNNAINIRSLAKVIIASLSGLRVQQLS